MATLDIEGRRVDVDDSFLKLSPQQQNETVMHIATSLNIGRGSSPQRVAMPQFDPMGNFTGGTEDVEQFQQNHSPAVAQSDDILKGAAGGIVRGAAGIAGLPALAADYLTWGAGKAAQKLTGQSAEDYNAQEQRRRESRMFPGALDALKPEGIQRGIEKATGPAYVPTTRAGRFASTAAEFGVGGAIGNPANMARNLLAYGVVPGLLSEAGGQAFEGSAAETPARIVGALAGGVGGALATRGNPAGKMIREAVGDITPQQLDAAEQLFQRAQQAGQPISRAEAIQAVTQGSTRIGDLQHTVEGMGGMRDFYAARPAQNEAAARRAFEGIAPQAADPSQIGQAVGEAASQFMRQTPEANILADILWRAGPRTTPEQAGNVIQSELGRVHQGREGMRAALAERDYGAARNAPATIPLNGGHRVADVTKHYLDRPDIPILLDPAERAAAKTQWFKDNNPTTRTPIVGERTTEFGQVDASAVLRQLDGALETAKGAVRQGLQAARSALFRPDGALDMSVAGLHNSRQAIDDLISQAQRAGANQTVLRLQEAKRSLDQVLEQVPAYGEARTNFQAASRPLEPFEQSRAPGRIIERDEFNTRYVMPPERVPAAIQNNGPSAARDFNSVATPAAREAFEQNIVTQVLDRATREGANLSSDGIRQALRQNEDLLRQYPGVRDKLESIAIARDGLARIEGTPIGKLAQRDLTTKQAVEALFPANPLPNSADEILTSVSALAARSPRVARELVRTHVESVFNEASQRMAQGGFNQSGGAKFAAVLRGNPQQADNLEAAVVAMSPHGRRIWQGFNEFLENLEAQQYRQATGSRTAFKAPGVEDMKSGGLANNAAQIVGSGGLRLPRKVADAIANWNVGRNLDDIARLLTDPTASNQFRALAMAPAGSGRAAALTTRLLHLAIKGRDERPRVVITRDRDGN